MHSILCWICECACRWLKPSNESIFSDSYLCAFYWEWRNTLWLMMISAYSTALYSTIPCCVYELPLSLIGQVYSTSGESETIENAAVEWKIEAKRAIWTAAMGKMIDWLDDETTQALSVGRTQFTRAFNNHHQTLKSLEGK